MSIQVISFNCVLTNKAGQLISTTYNRDVLNAKMGEPALLKGLVTGMQNLSPGEKRRIELNAQDAYGYYDPQKVILYPRKKLKPNLCLGELITIAGKSGTLRTYRILHFYNDMVHLDGNHPLAGQDLVFEIETLAVREATKEEITESSNCVSTQTLH